MVLDQQLARHNIPIMPPPLFLPRDHASNTTRTHSPDSCAAQSQSANEHSAMTYSLPSSPAANAAVVNGEPPFTVTIFELSRSVSEGSGIAVPAPPHSYRSRQVSNSEDGDNIVMSP
jgi:hypothetical protein